MYDPLEKAEETAKIVCKGNLRKYRRFRPARFYGGIATADCVGCNLLCRFCWSWREAVRPEACGEFLAPEAVAGRLTDIARRNRFGKVRISGNEPTICREHLIEVLEIIPKDLLFILETNGILIGHDGAFAGRLARFPNLYVRVSLKGTTGEEFSMLTGASPAGFLLQLRALEYLHRAGVRVQPAVMVSFSPVENVEGLRKRLGAIAPELAEIEVEELVLYREVEERLKKAGIRYRTAYTPDGTPPEQI
jgi:uncharacterized Fe-S cluster-containing radical SAM superfamily protein